MTALLALHEVLRTYKERRSNRPIQALKIASLEFARGETAAIVGPNGSGKSTLLEMLAFLRPPDQGRVVLDGHDPWLAGDPVEARRRCPLLLQRTVLFKTTVLGNVMSGLQFRGVPRGRARQRAEETLSQLGLAGLSNRGPRELSGGERRRVALARILALAGDILLLDEPTAHVDEDNTALIEDAIRRLHVAADGQSTVILATHDSQQAARLAQRVIRLSKGEITSMQASP